MFVEEGPGYNFPSLAKANLLLSLIPSNNP